MSRPKDTKKALGKASGPKRPTSPYFFFTKEVRPALHEQMKKDNPKVKTTDVAREMGQMWRHLQDKSKYQELAAEDRKRYWQQKEAAESPAIACSTPTASPAPEAMASPAPVAMDVASPAPAAMDVASPAPAAMVVASPTPVAMASPAAVVDLESTSGVQVSESEISPEVRLLVANGSPIYAAHVGEPVLFSS
ncbi:MAG: hypothetical protein KVP17_004190 [Porospora cf. gigantea B]|uniref:uncharacterized protein n=1 Tax=Porospora cf. gigantea B TaxID=2853592 RepID=UPI003571F07A|nr:MAG: hypothetical protein KVP17_004190 [Porospora cf. gigantea B]